MHDVVPGSAVICQNSILQDGELEPQNELNNDNWCLFELCDGIVLNCRWDESQLRKSAVVAGKRKGDIYAGVDVLARNTSYTGSYDMYKAVAIAREYGLSTAIFGAGSVYEQEDDTKFKENQCLLWALPDECCSQWRITTLPLSTTFCQGFGTSLYKQGRDVRSAPWFNLSRQQLQPRDQGRKLCGGSGSAMVHTLDSYAGGGCLCLEYDPKEAPRLRIVPYFRLFGFDLPLGSLCVSYTYKSKERSCPAGHGINLVLKVRDDAGKTEELSLSSIITGPPGGNYIVERSVDSSAQGDQGVTEHGWLTRKYHVKDITDSATLEEIGISFNSNVEMAFLIGELVVKRPDGAADSDTEMRNDVEGVGRPDTEARLQEWLGTSDDATSGQHEQTEQVDEPICFNNSMSSDESD